MLTPLVPRSFEKWMLAALVTANLRALSGFPRDNKSERNQKARNWKDSIVQALALEVEM